MQSKELFDEYASDWPINASAESFSNACQLVHRSSQIIKIRLLHLGLRYHLAPDVAHVKCVYNQTILTAYFALLYQSHEFFQFITSQLIPVGIEFDSPFLSFNEHGICLSRGKVYFRRSALDNSILGWPTENKDNFYDRMLVEYVWNMPFQHTGTSYLTQPRSHSKSYHPSVVQQTLTRGPLCLLISAKRTTQKLNFNH